MTITCLISDLDGTLVDNREANSKAYTQAFQDMGIEMKPEDYSAIFGLRYPEMIARLAPDLEEEKIRQVKELKARYYQANVGLIKPNQPLIDFFRLMRTNHKTALATTASRINAEFVLDYFDLKAYFDVFVYGEDVKASKPDPECYRLCIERCEVEPGQCLIFEDSAVGIKAAESAGAGVIRIFRDSD